jgi:hypothetical protein
MKFRALKSLPNVGHHTWYFHHRSQVGSERWHVKRGNPDRAIHSPHLVPSYTIRMSSPLSMEKNEVRDTHQLTVQITSVDTLELLNLL